MSNPCLATGSGRSVVLGTSSTRSRVSGTTVVLVTIIQPFGSLQEPLASRTHAFYRVIWASLGFRNPPSKRSEKRSFSSYSAASYIGYLELQTHPPRPNAVEYRLRTHRTIGTRCVQAKGIDDGHSRHGRSPSPLLKETHDDTKLCRLSFRCFGRPLHFFVTS